MPRSSGSASRSSTASLVLALLLDRGRRGALGRRPARQRGPARGYAGVHGQGRPQGGERDQDGRQDVAGRLELGQAQPGSAPAVADEQRRRARRRRAAPPESRPGPGGSATTRASSQTVPRMARSTLPGSVVRPVLAPDRGHGGHRDRDGRRRLARAEAARRSRGTSQAAAREHREPDRDRHGGLTVVTRVGQRLDQRERAA